MGTLRGMIRPITTREAATLAGISVGAFRSAMKRARDRGLDMKLPGPDKRTPMWDADAVLAYLAARPGPGAWRECREALAKEREGKS